MIRIILLGIGLITGQLLNAQGDWNLKLDKDDITIYTREKEDGPIKEYKTSAIIESPIQNVYDFLTDLEYRPEWLMRCDGLNIIDTVQEDLIRYQIIYNFPWPLSKRDLVVESKFTAEFEKGKAHLLTLSSGLDYPPDKGIVRMGNYREEAFLTEIDSARTEFRSQGFADPGGNIPAWVINMFLVDGSYDSMISIREETSKKKNKMPGKE